MQNTLVLFFGLKLTPANRQLLESENPKRVELLTRGGETELEIFESEGERFLGKCAGEDLSADGLELLKQNVTTLIRRLNAQITFDEGELVLMVSERTEEI